jgi:hypothetical protein
MTVGWTFSDLIQFWSDHIPIQTQVVGGVPQFIDASGRYQADIPYVIQYAEGLMYRDPDFDFLATRQTDSSQSTAAGSRYVTIPPTYIVVERLNLITPAGAQPDASGASRVPLIRGTPAMLDTMWPETSSTQPPTFGLTHWSIFDQQIASPASKVRIAPTPDAAYVAEFKGTFRPDPLAQTASAQTFLTMYLPDVFAAATMVSWCGLMKNYAAAGVQGAVDDPQQGVYWMSQYSLLKRGAAVEEARKKSQSAAWGTMSPAPLAATAR